MRFPNHILLDINKPSKTVQSNYWVVKYQNTFNNDLYFKKTIRLIFRKKSSTVKIRRPRTSLYKINSKFENLTSKVDSMGVSLLWQLFDINFIKKERLYTKLKYSRSPQYDIVSGGLAALLAGFLGFLISEKFGIELVDSGDFYTFFMYCVFLVFSIRPLIRILSKEDSIWNIFSYKFLIDYLYTILNLSFNFLKKNYNSKINNLFVSIYKLIKSLIK
jgi:hypothetical protein